MDKKSLVELIDGNLDVADVIVDHTYTGIEVFADALDDFGITINDKEATDLLKRCRNVVAEEIVNWAKENNND